jgi:large conductance mechanosensitive channel
LVKEFREFIMRGNVIDLAVAVVMGAAFTAIINSLVNDIVMPLIGLILGGVDFASLSVTVGSASIMYGAFIQAIVNFLLIALVLFFIVRAVNAARPAAEAAPEAPPEPTGEEKLLIEIRDLLKNRAEV